MNKRITQNLRVELAVPELLEYADKLAHAVADKQRIENAKASANSQFKSQIDEIAGRVGYLQQVVANKAEYRDVECEECYRYESGEVRIYRCDTMELVSSRLMTEDEKQAELDLRQGDAQ